MQKISVFPRGAVQSTYFGICRIEKALYHTLEQKKWLKIPSLFQTETLILKTEVLKMLWWIFLILMGGYEIIKVLIKDK